MLSDAERAELTGSFDVISGVETGSTRFEQIGDDAYRLQIGRAILLEVSRLRREHHELQAELMVRCALPGARTVAGVLHVGSFNLSAPRARKERAGILAERAQTTDEIDWTGLLEELCQRTIAAERRGQPAIDLREVPRPTADDSISIDGLILPVRHSTIIFGDGAAGKSYLALYLAGQMAMRGINVLFADWELDAPDHRDRLERVFGASMPRIYYARCERPLVSEVDRLQRLIREHNVSFGFFDSIGFGSDGPPEAGETALTYCRALRRLNIGSLHLAHITKNAENSDQRPFGSAFWHNSARATWFVKSADPTPDGRVNEIGLFPRKANLSHLPRPCGFKIGFTQDRTYFAAFDPAETPELAEKMSVRDRMRHLLQCGSLTVDEVAEAIDVKRDTVYKTVQRHTKIFRLFEGGKIALAQ